MPVYTNINNADDVVVRKVTEVAAPHASLNVASGWHSGLTAGKLIGPDSSFEAVEADNRASAGPVYAYGIALHDARQSYTIGTNLSGQKDYQRLDLFEDNITVKMDSANLTLTPGPVWLSSGGSLTQTEPGTSGDVRQVVGWAISSTEWVVNIQGPEII